MSCHVMPCHSISCHAMSCHVIPCHAMSFHLMPCHLMPCHVISCHAWKKQPTGFKASPEAAVFGLRNSMNHSVSCVKQSMAYVMSLDIMMSATCAMQHIACNAWHLQNGNMECPPDIHCNFIMANHVSHDSKPMVHGQPGFMHEKGFFLKGQDMTEFATQSPRVSQDTALNLANDRTAHDKWQFQCATVAHGSMCQCHTQVSCHAKVMVSSLYHYKNYMPHRQCQTQVSCHAKVMVSSLYH